MFKKKLVVLHLQWHRQNAKKSLFHFKIRAGRPTATTSLPMQSFEVVPARFFIMVSIVYTDNDISNKTELRVYLNIKNECTIDLTNTDNESSQEDLISLDADDLLILIADLQAIYKHMING